jgi:hypothetical protein
MLKDSIRSLDLSIKSQHPTDRPHHYWKSLSGDEQAQWKHIADESNIKNLFSIVEKILFVDKDCYQTFQDAEETGPYMLSDYRDFGYGKHFYYYEKISVEISYDDLFHHKNHLKKSTS